MCLIVDKTAKIRRTFRRRRCWKVLFYSYADRKYYGPYFQDFEYHLGGTEKITDSEVISIKTRAVVGVDGVSNCVDNGLHTFLDLDSAKLECDHLNRVFRQAFQGCFVVVPCFIPMFSRFIKGLEEGYRNLCYVSDRLRISKNAIYKGEQKPVEQDTEIHDLWFYIREWNDKLDSGI